DRIPLPPRGGGASFRPASSSVSVHPDDHPTVTAGVGEHFPSMRRARLRSRSSTLHRPVLDRRDLFTSARLRWASRSSATVDHIDGFPCRSPGRASSFATSASGLKPLVDVVPCRAPSGRRRQLLRWTHLGIRSHP